MLNLLLPGRKDFTASIVEEGMLEANFISCILQEKVQSLKLSITIAGKSNYDGPYEAKFDANKNPYWSKKIVSEFGLISNNTIKSIYAYIYYETGTIFKDQTKVGEFYVDWEECLRWPGQYLSKKSYLFKAHIQ